jgi:outer membrane murein-binding lipoprotein Lpp
MESKAKIKEKEKKVRMLKEKEFRRQLTKKMNQLRKECKPAKRMPNETKQ